MEVLRQSNLVMVVGDSGSGKSSLVRAGLVPRFRGGAFADSSSEQPDPTFWQIIEMRPQKDPFERLVDAVNEAATKAGISAKDRGALADWLRTKDAAKIRDAIRDSAPSSSQALLIVDQFEELWTLGTEADRRAFVAMLNLLADTAGAGCRIVITMRRDYYNLCSQFPELYKRLEARDRSSKYSLRRMQDASLRSAILAPLRLTEYRENQSIDAFADAVLRDVGDRPGDLALLEMSLAETWRHRGEHDGRLLDSYVARGGVAGALANAAEDVFREKLGRVPIDLVKSVFVRLVRLGDTGGTTRRIARRAEFTDVTWPLAQQLAGGSPTTAASVIIDDGKYPRLVSIAGTPGDEAVEIAHEALATQWPRYQAWLEDAAPDKRIFDRLTDVAAEWIASSEHAHHLARGSDIEAFARLREERLVWLSNTEDRFVRESLRAESDRLAREQLLADERMQLLRDRAEAELKYAIEEKARKWVTAIGLIAVVIVDAVIGLTAIDRYRDQMRQAHESTVRFATLASNYETNLLWQSNRIIQNLAHQPPIIASVAASPSRGSECAVLLETAIRPYPSYAVAVLRNAKGEAVCQSDPAAQPPNASDADWFKTVMQSRRETVSGYLYAARLQEGVIIYAAPVLGDRNEAVGVLSLAIRLEWLSAIGQEPGLPPDAMVYLLDRDGHVLVGPKAQGVDTQAGLPDSQAIQEVVNRHIRAFDSVGQDGIERNYAVNVIGDNELFVLLGQPTGRLIEPLRTSLWIQIGIVIFISVAAFATIIGARVLGAMSATDRSPARTASGST